MKIAARSALIIAIFSGLACLAAAHSGKNIARAQTKSSSASGAAMTPDKGKFRILLAAQSIGTEDFDISLTEGKWIVHGTTVAHTPGGDDLKTTGALQLAPDGTPIHYAWSAESPKKASGSVDFDGGTAKTLTDFGSGHPYHQDFKFLAPLVIVLDNNLYEQYAVLVRLYDWNTGGDQTFPVLIPQDITPGTIRISHGAASGGGLTELVVKSADLEIHLFCDSSHKLMRLEVPASRVVVERE
jgi:hypothetical protein